MSQRHRIADFDSVEFDRSWSSFETYATDFVAHTAAMAPAVVGIYARIRAAVHAYGDGWHLTATKDEWCVHAGAPNWPELDPMMASLKARGLLLVEVRADAVTIAVPSMHEVLARKQAMRESKRRQRKSQQKSAPGSEVRSAEPEPGNAEDESAAACHASCATSATTSSETSDANSNRKSVVPPTSDPLPPSSSSSAGSPSAASPPPGPQSAAADSAAESDDCPPEAKQRRDAILAVIAHYRTYHPKGLPKPRPSSIEWRRCRDRLAEGFTSDDLKLAIDGIHLDPWNTGKDPKSAGRTYLDLELALRDASHVRRFIETAQQRRREKLKATGGREISEGERYLEPGRAVRDQTGRVVVEVGRYGGVLRVGPDGKRRIFDFDGPDGTASHEVWVEPDNGGTPQTHAS